MPAPAPGTTGGGGPAGATAGAQLASPEVVALLTKLVEVLTQLIAALQAQAGAGALTPPGTAGGGAAPGAPAPGAAAPVGAPAPGAAAPVGAPAPQVAVSEKKAASWTVTSMATGKTWTMTPGQDQQLKDNPGYSLTPKYADGTMGAALPKGQLVPT